MKNSKLMLSVLTLAGISLLGTSPKKNYIKTKAEAVESFEIENVFNWIDQTNSFFDEDGAHGIRKANNNDLFSNGIGIKQQLNVENNKVATVTFQIPDYEHETRELRDNHVSVKNGGEDRPYDIYLLNVDTNYYAIFRLWAGNSAVADQYSSWIQFCESKTSGWETYSGGYVSGVCTNGSSYTISFDTTNFFSVKCDWLEGDNKMVPFHQLGEIGSKEQQYLDFMQTNFGNASEIEFWFAHQKLDTDTVNEVVLKEVNGQSLAVNNDSFNDTLAPVVAPIHASKVDGKYELGAEYTMRLEKYLNDPSTKADFFVRPSSDPVCAIDRLVENSKLVGKLSSETEWKELGELDTSSSMIKKISFDKAGQWDLKLQVSDNASNVGESPIFNLDVLKGYSITLNGEVPTTGKVGTEIVLPSAIATDENDVERPVTVTVEDSLGNINEVSNYRFTPTTTGIYYVTYKSSYKDGDVTKTANSVEREIIVTKNNESNPSDNGDEKEKGCKGSVIATSGIICLISVFGLSALMMRKKEN